MTTITNAAVKRYIIMVIQIAEKLLNYYDSFCFKYIPNMV